MQLQYNLYSCYILIFGNKNTYKSIIGKLVLPNKLPVLPSVTEVRNTFFWLYYWVSRWLLPMLLNSKSKYVYER